MKSFSYLLLLAVAVPSLVLGALTLSSLREHQVVLEQRTASLHRKTTEELAAAAREVVEAARARFAAETDAFPGLSGPEEALARFDAWIRSAWPAVRVGFVVSRDGRVLSPFDEGGELREEARRFLGASEEYLTRRAPEVFFAESVPPALLGKAGSQNVLFARRHAASGSGIVSRIAGGHPQVLLWRRPAGRPDLAFGAMLTPRDLGELFAAFEEIEVPEPNAMYLTLLDERGRALWSSRPSFSPGALEPLVSTEVGDVLPFHRAGLFLDDPGALKRASLGFQRRVRWLVGLSLAAILGATFFVLFQAHRRAEEARRRVDFVSNLSHELKSPLTSIRMFAELLDRPGGDPDKRASWVRSIRREAGRLGRLLDDLLDVRRSSRGVSLAEPRPVDAGPIVREAWEAVQPRLRQAGLEASLDLPEGPVDVRADPEALARILDALLENACTHAVRDGRAEGLLRLAVERGREEVVFLLDDDGPGVAREDRERIFEPFVRVGDHLAGEHRGAGLGLALARRLAEDMGGELVCEASPTGGARFRLVLERAAGAARLDAAPPAEAAS